MQKHQSLFDYLIEQKLSNAEQLQVWIDSGKCSSKLTHSKSSNITLEISYTAHVIITDTNHDQIVLFSALVWWLNVYQPEREKIAFTFELDHKNKTTADVYIGIPVTEKYRTEKVEGGKTQIINCNPPVLIDNEPFDAELWIRDKAVLQTSDSGTAELITE